MDCKRSCSLFAVSRNELNAAMAGFERVQAVPFCFPKGSACALPFARYFVSFCCAWGSHPCADCSWLLLMTTRVSAQSVPCVPSSRCPAFCSTIVLISHTLNVQLDACYLGMENRSGRSQKTVRFDLGWGMFGRAGNCRLGMRRGTLFLMYIPIPGQNQQYFHWQS